MSVEPSLTPDEQRKATIRRSNRVLALGLSFLVVLFFAITVVKMAH